MTSQGGDELRARAYLRRLSVRPFGHQEPTVPDRPVTPTRIIPAGAPLPARPPEPGELPPWYTRPPAPPAPPPPPPPPPPTPGPIEVRVTLVPVPVPEPEPEPGLWARLWDRLTTWRMAVAVCAALLPWAGGDSPVGLWSHTVHQARTEAGISTAYLIAGVAVGAAWAVDHYSSPPGQPGRTLPRFLLVTAGLGALGVLHWYDPILMLTGVNYR